MGSRPSKPQEPSGKPQPPTSMGSRPSKPQEPSGKPQPPEAKVQAPTEAPTGPPSEAPAEAEDVQINVTTAAWGGPPQIELPPTQENLDPDTFLFSIPLLTAFTGFITGTSKASSTASRVFLAENAHRTPNTVQGWYFYTKTKNYHVILSGFKGGIKRALIYGGITSAFLFTDVFAGQLRTWAQKRVMTTSRSTVNETAFPGYVRTGHSIPYKRKFPHRAEQADSDPASATSNGGTAGMDVDAHMDVDIDRPSYDPDQDIALLSSTNVHRPRPVQLRPYPWWSQNAAQERAESPWRVADGVLSGSLVTLAMGYTARLGFLTTRRTASIGALAGAVWGLGSYVNYNREKWLPQPPLETSSEPQSQ